MKTCRICKTDKPLNDFAFNKGGKDGRRNDCKVCNRLYNLKWRAKNVEKRRNDAFLREYGIDLKEFDRMAKAQDGKCAICKQPESWFDYRDKSKPRQLCVDHDHSTGKVRGLLCGSCNVMLGRAKDSVLMLESAIKYLNKSKVVSHE